MADPENLEIRTGANRPAHLHAKGTGTQDDPYMPIHYDKQAVELLRSIERLLQVLVKHHEHITELEVDEINMERK